MKPEQKLRKLKYFLLKKNGEIIFEDGVQEIEIIAAAAILNLNTKISVVQESLEDLVTCIKYGNCYLPNKGFKAIIKPLLNLLDSEHSEVVISALETLRIILTTVEMISQWGNFLELILLKIFNCYRNEKKASREIDIIIPQIAAVLPLKICIHILNPVISAGTFPKNLCALKLLNELVDKQGNELTDNHLDILMPNLALLTDDSQSMIRCAAIICIAKLYIVMGEEKVKPKFSLFNGSKIRLLHLYIDKTMDAKSKG